jgi:uncharacterized protein YndB with AHSA1/START domain
MPKAYASTVLDAPAREVWAVIRDFNGLPTWHPAIADSEIEDGKTGDQVGCVRSFHLKDGAHLRERLLAFSDPEMFMTYNFEKTPFDVQNYCATLRLTPITDGDRCFATFGGVVFKGGLDALKDRFDG